MREAPDLALLFLTGTYSQYLTSIEYMNRVEGVSYE
jgi:hypothetical protein